MYHGKGRKITRYYGYYTFGELRVLDRGKWRDEEIPEQFIV